MDTPVIKELKKKEVKSVENFIDLSRSKILVIYPKGDEDIYSLNELIINVLNITDELIEYQEDISIDEIVRKLRSGNYSDLYFESKLSQEQIKLLHQIYEFDHSIIIKIYQSNKLIKGRLIEFILNYQKYKFVNHKGNVIS